MSLRLALVIVSTSVSTRGSNINHGVYSVTSSYLLEQSRNRGPKGTRCVTCWQAIFWSGERKKAEREKKLDVFVKERARKLPFHHPLGSEFLVATIFPIPQTFNLRRREKESGSPVMRT